MRRTMCSTNAQHEENNVCDQCDKFDIFKSAANADINPNASVVLRSCSCCWVCYLVFLILGAVMSILWTNDFALNASGESWRITAVETWSVKPGDGSTSLWMEGWWCNKARGGSKFCGVELEVFLSQMNNNTINQTYCQSCESYTTRLHRHFVEWGPA
jgi:hypothetical protein